jgi:protein subunit release factor B
MPLTISDEIEIADWEISEVFVRSSGPGGQNVNKVSTAVELRFEAERSPNLPAPVKTRLRKLAGRRWTKEGAIVLQVEDTRSQGAQPRDRARAAGGAYPRGSGETQTTDRDQADLWQPETAAQGEESARRCEGHAGEGAGGGLREL